MGFTREWYEGHVARLAAKKFGSSRTACVPDQTKAEQIEKKLHEKIEAFCKERRWPIVHSRMDRKATVTEGAPDFIILADNGITLKIECKARNEKPDDKQDTWHFLARHRGHAVHVVRSYPGFLAALKDENVPI